MAYDRGIGRLDDRKPEFEERKKAAAKRAGQGQENIQRAVSSAGERAGDLPVLSFWKGSKGLSEGLPEVDLENFRLPDGVGYAVFEPVVNESEGWTGSPEVRKNRFEQDRQSLAEIAVGVAKTGAELAQKSVSPRAHRYTQEEVIDGLNKTGERLYDYEQQIRESENRLGELNLRRAALLGTIIGQSVELDSMRQEINEKTARIKEWPEMEDVEKVERLCQEYNSLCQTYNSNVSHLRGVEYDSELLLEKTKKMGRAYESDSQRYTSFEKLYEGSARDERLNEYVKNNYQGHADSVVSSLRSPEEIGAELAAVGQQIQRAGEQLKEVEASHREEAMIYQMSEPGREEESPGTKEYEQTKKELEQTKAQLEERQEELLEEQELVNYLGHIQQVGYDDIKAYYQYTGPMDLEGLGIYQNYMSVQGREDFEEAAARGAKKGFEESQREDMYEADKADARKKSPLYREDLEMFVEPEQFSAETAQVNQDWPNQAIYGWGEEQRKKEEREMFRKYFTEDEKKVFYYLLETEGRAKADNFFHIVVGREGVARKGISLSREMQNQQIGGILEAGDLAFRSGVDNYFRGLSALGQEEPLPPNYLEYASQDYRASLEGPTGFAYDLVQGVGNTVPSVLVSSAAMALGLPPGVGKLLGSVSEGASAGGNAYWEKLQEGYSPEEARAYSVMVGAFATGFQYVLGGISALGENLKMDVVARNLSRIDGALGKVASVAWQGVKESGEEALEMLLEPMIATVALGEEYSPPEIGELFYEAALGFCTAGLSEIVTEGLGRKGGELERGLVEDMIAYGDSFPEGTMAWEFSRSLEMELETGEAITSLRLGEIAASVGEGKQAWDGGIPRKQMAEPYMPEFQKPEGMSDSGWYAATLQAAGEETGLGKSAKLYGVEDFRKENAAREAERTGVEAVFDDTLPVGTRALYDPEAGVMRLSTRYRYGKYHGHTRTDKL